MNTVSQNVEFVRRWFQRFGQLTPTDFEEMIDPSIVNHPVPENQRHGRESFERVIRYVIAAAPDQLYAVHEVMADGDLVVARVTWQGTFTGEYLGVRGNGHRFACTQYHTFRIQQGKFAEHWAARDDLGFFRQVGLAPPR
jgi:predicted ester cyclase